MAQKYINYMNKIENSFIIVVKIINLIVIILSIELYYILKYINNQFLSCNF